MNITILTGLESEEPKSYDIVVDQVASALRKKGHRASIFGVHDDLRKLVTGLSRRKTDLVFNLLESFGDNLGGDVAVAGVLDLLNLRYTGGGPGELYLRQDKGLAKKVFAFENILYPHFAVFSQDSDFETAGNLRMPLFVKPLTADASIGIDGDSLVRDTVSLMKRVLAIHEKVKDSALVEEYIEGREFYVGVLGNREPVAFPPIEMDFSGMPEGMPHVAGTKAKWKKNSAEYKGTKSVLADVPDELRAKLQKAALDAYRALRVRDYGRVDLRLTETGDIYVIEVNASCYLEAESEFATAAQAMGIEFPDLVGRIVDLAVERYS
ncbi:MAG TPA: ATP-grasp domain-containing protein [Thermoanaerobaculia bacterium]|jgi:D-alanine-D-alanine ligase|nr:ATP-grasp domain-containing protein [Thermoanaerobaculia bacterium]